VRCWVLRRPDDVVAAAMTAAACEPRPEAFLELESLFGDLRREPTFVQAYLSARRSLAADGVHATLDRLLAR